MLVKRYHPTRPIPRLTRINHLLDDPLIHQIAADLPELTQRRRRYPTALYLAWGALSRLYRSGNQLDAELTQGNLWPHIIDRYNHAADRHQSPPVNPHAPPLNFYNYRVIRNHLAEHLDNYLDSFTRHSIHAAQQIGLINPHGPGSRTHPHPTRTIYGDGTIVRPIYRKSDNGQQDPDAATHVRHDGPIWGNNFVLIATRGPQRHQRIILNVGRVDAPGNEASTAVNLIAHIHTHAGDAIQAVVYDGAFRGAHIETIQTHLGYIVINKVHPQKRTEDETIYRQVPLGQWIHTPNGKPCTHTLVAHNGSIHNTTMTDRGELELSEPLQTIQIRRYPRKRTNTHRYTIGVTINCPKEPFAAWVNPHADDHTNTRPDQLRIIPESNPDFQTLYGLRNDAEAINAAYKQTLPVQRATAKGWQPQLIDLTNWATLTNTTNRQHHQPTPPTPS